MQLVTSYREEHKKDLEYVVESVLNAGCPSIQFAWGNCTDLELFKKAEVVRELTERYGADMCVNNRLDVAMAVGSDSVHIGQGDIPIDYARLILPPSIKIGLTIDDVEQLKTGCYTKADYLGVGVVHSTRTKTHDKPSIGLHGLAEVKRHTGMPIIAIGGITEGNAVETRLHGADSLAVIGAVYNSENITKTVSRLMNKGGQDGRYLI